MPYIILLGILAFVMLYLNLQSPAEREKEDEYIPPADK